MKKRLLSLLLFLFVIVGTMPLTVFAADTVTAADDYAGGSGTKNDPFRISNAAELLYFNRKCATEGDFCQTQPDPTCDGTVFDGLSSGTLLTNVYHGAYFVLTADIDCSGITEWSPCMFAGSFDGQGHTISNLNIGYNSYNNGTMVYAGFFETLYDGTLSNVTFQNCKIEITSDLAVYSYGDVEVGIAAAEAYYAGFDNVSVKGCTVENGATQGVSSTKFTGGLVGFCDGAYVNRCMIADTDVSACEGYVGGITGRLVTLLYDIKDYIDAGLVMRFGGDANKFGIENSGIDADSTVKNEDGMSTGGMVGWWTPRKYGGAFTGTVNAIIKNNYCHAGIDIETTSGQGVGGLIGELSYAEYPVVIENCYFAGSITDTQTERTGKGSIVGYITRSTGQPQPVTLNNCYGPGTLSLKALGEDRVFNGSSGGDSVKEMLGCATFDTAGTLTAETAGDTLAAGTLLEALNAWVTAEDADPAATVAVYLPWRASTAYPVFSVKKTVTYDANGKGTAPAAAEVEKGATFPAPAQPAETGYVFGGWYTDAACTDANKWDFENNTVTEDLTLYAKWTICDHSGNTTGDDGNCLTAVVCSVCNAECVPAKSEHNYATEWKSDKDGHWHECSCGVKTDAAEHTPKTANAKQATTTEKGYTGDTVCSVCGYEIAVGEEIPAVIQPTESSSPQTGDNSNLSFWFAWFFMSGIGFVGTAGTWCGKKKKVMK